MSDEPDHKTPLEIIGNQICDCLPESLRKDKKFVFHFGELCGFLAGWVIGKKVIESFLGKGDGK